MAHVEAEFRDGVLHPATPLGLKVGERVRLIVLRKSDPARWDPGRLARAADEDRALAQEGLAEWAGEIDRLDHR